VLSLHHDIVSLLIYSILYIYLLNNSSAWKKSNSSSPKYIKQPPLLLYKSTEAKQRIIDKVTECPVDKSISKYLKIQAKDNKRKSENGTIYMYTFSYSLALISCLYL